MYKIYAGGSQEISITSGDKIAVFTEDVAKVYYRYDKTNLAPVDRFEQEVNGAEVVLTPGAGVGTVVLYAGAEEVLYSTGTAPTTSKSVTSLQSKPGNVGESITSISVVNNEIFDASVISVYEHRNQVLYQNASGGSVSMTTADGTDLDAEFPELQVGDAIAQYHASNDAANTSTITGGTGVTVIGNAAVTATGGQYLLVKSGTATYDLIRVG